MIWARHGRLDLDAINPKVERPCVLGYKSVVVVAVVVVIVVAVVTRGPVDRKGLVAALAHDRISALLRAQSPMLIISASVRAIRPPSGT